jgi:hypothetical protein
MRRTAGPREIPSPGKAQGPVPGLSSLPLVALFFSVEKSNTGDSVVWCARPHWTLIRPESPFEISTVGIVDLPHVSERVSVQKGVFSIHPAEQLPMGEWKAISLSKVTVDNSSRVGIRGQLRTLGVDRGSLFPDVDGIARALNAKFYATEADELGRASST